MPDANPDRQPHQRALGLPVWHHDIGEWLLHLQQHQPGPQVQRQRAGGQHLPLTAGVDGQQAQLRPAGGHGQSSLLQGLARLGRQCIGDGHHQGRRDKAALHLPVPHHLHPGALPGQRLAADRATRLPLQLPALARQVVQRGLQPARRQRHGGVALQQHGLVLRLVRAILADDGQQRGQRGGQGDLLRRIDRAVSQGQEAQAVGQWLAGHALRHGTGAGWQQPAQIGWQACRPGGGQRAASGAQAHQRAQPQGQHGRVLPRRVGQARHGALGPACHFQRTGIAAAGHGGQRGLQRLGHGSQRAGAALQGQEGDFFFDAQRLGPGSMQAAGDVPGCLQRPRLAGRGAGLAQLGAQQLLHRSVEHQAAAALCGMEAGEPQVGLDARFGARQQLQSQPAQQAGIDPHRQ